jgi:hypothetical protein
MTEAEARFESFLAGISHEALRVRVEGSAMENSWGDPALVNATDDQRWKVALSTAEECFACARQYYPELFQLRSA